MAIERSCGTIPYAVVDGASCYLIIKSMRGNYCGFPKGHIEDGETEEQTALRETLEETTLEVSLLPGFKRSVSYVMPNGITKNVVYFLATFDAVEFKSNTVAEAYSVLLLPFADAHKLLSFENDKRLLIEANDFLKERFLNFVD